MNNESSKPRFTRPWRLLAVAAVLAVMATTFTTVVTSEVADAHPNMACGSFGDATSTGGAFGLDLYRHRSNVQVCWQNWPWVDHTDTVTNRIEKIGIGALDQTWTDDVADGNAHWRKHTGMGGARVTFNNFGISFEVDVRRAHEFTHQFFSNWNGQVAGNPGQSSGWWWA